MKKFLLWCCGVFLAIVATTAVTTTLISCDKTGPRILQKPTVGVKEVSNALDSIVNPRLNTTRDVFTLQNKLLTNAYIDSVFMSMDQKTLENVSTVVFKKLHVVTKDDIVSEYIKNSSVYNNLPNNTPPDTSPVANKTTEEKNLGPITIVKEGTTTVTEAQQTRVVEQSANSYKDTIIDGKPAIIKQ